MNVVLQGLEARGLVIRPAEAAHGRQLPAELTPAGRAQLQAASTAVHAVEVPMCAGLGPARQEELLSTLAVCARNLTETT